MTLRHLQLISGVCLFVASAGILSFLVGFAAGFEGHPPAGPLLALPGAILGAPLLLAVPFILAGLRTAYSQRHDSFLLHAAALLASVALIMLAAWFWNTVL